MDGTGRLFQPLLDVLAPTLAPTGVSYPVDVVRARLTDQSERGGDV
jgi:hypothetical protein